MNVRATCENCKCKGKLYKSNQSGEVILIPTVTDNDGPEAEDSKRYEKGFLAPHGFATAIQMINFVAWGTLFWVTVMLIANYVGFEKNRFKAGVGSYCVREYKKCSLEFDWNVCASSMYNCGDVEDDNYSKFIFTAPQKIANFSNDEKSLAVYSDAQNKANENICLFTAHVSNNICENLCFSSDFSYDSDGNYEFIHNEDQNPDQVFSIRYNQQTNKECKSICLLASDLEIEEDCPLHKRCPNGCPCPGFKCSKDVFDFDLAGVVFYSKDDFIGQSSIYNISLQSNTIKFEDLTPGNSWLQSRNNFCIVNFHGIFYIINEEHVNFDNYKLTFYEIDQNRNLKKLSEDYVKVKILFGRSHKICSRGIYQNEEERIIFCSQLASRGICHSYAMNNNKIMEIYNRPESTLPTPDTFSYWLDVSGFTFQNKLTTLKMVNSFRTALITSFDGREKSGNHLWTTKHVDFPTSYRDRTIHEENIGVETQHLAAFSDNEGIIFITMNTDDLNGIREETIRFHRIYRNNWFFLGRYKFTKRLVRISSSFTEIFMLQGNFFLIERSKMCLEGSYTFLCYENKILPSKIHLLDRATDRFVEQKIDINYKNYVSFGITF